MGRTYSGRNSENLTGYKLIRSQLRGRTDLTADQLAVIAMYAKANDETGKAAQYKAQVVDHIGRLTSAERAAVNAVLTDAGIEGVS